MKRALTIIAFFLFSSNIFAQISPYINVINNTGCTILVRLAAHEGGSGTWSVPFSLYTNNISILPGGNVYRFDIAAVTLWSMASAGMYTATTAWGDWDRVFYSIPSTGTLGSITNGSGTISSGSSCGTGTVTWGAGPAPGPGYWVTFN